MDLLIKNVRIQHETLAIQYTGSQDVFVSQGIIQQIGNNITVDGNVAVFDAEGMVLSPGWIDIFADFADPGFEHRETLSSGAEAALNGGYTTVFAIPNTQPIVKNKSAVAYVINQAKALPINILPIGSISQDAVGKDLSEMYDMSVAGCVAFSDGKKVVQSASLMLKALQYVKAFDGVLITQPIEESFGSNGLMSEGIVSTQLGMPGMPSVAEHIMILRDIELLRYTGSRLHITGISTAKSIALIAQAKREGLNITCSVTPYHLLLTDKDLRSYDTHLKVNPPLRTEEDRLALIEAVKNGTVDIIASHHFPQHNDDKDCEFEYAKNGMIGLQTAYNVVNTAIPGLSDERIVALFSLNPRKIFGLKEGLIQPQAIADFTLFTRNGQFVFTEKNNKSKSHNSPFLGQSLNGKVVGVFTKNQFHAF